MAAPRTVWSEVVKFGTLFGASPLINFTKFHVSISNPLAPPMGQSWRCVYTRFFWTKWLIFWNEVSLYSLEQDESNVLWRHTQFSAILNVKEKRFFATFLQFLLSLLQRLPQIIFRPSLTKVIPWRLYFSNHLLVTANQTDVAELMGPPFWMNGYVFSLPLL